ncbi:PucR family transcriptional regulator [Pseudalkalibacillus caeni]|uniref:PucR family transcriptional regulator n=1 Tax=Exobacillus caeni TaxID=2574798 RepID=A0A5R9F019_9BACL|nr:helix-turn-helix domain-containing protein [Pseudalkalibacillus caeni]TLS36847.1 PucR family transcriptional regulator [Pseudalkalibacillus caeni]
MENTERIFQVENINTATDLISSFLNKAVIIENKNFELLAYSSAEDEEFDQTQQKTILSKKCPIFIIDRLKKEGIVQQLERKPDPIRIAPIEELGFYQRIVISARHRGKTMGYIWVQESNNILLEGELKFLQDISPHIGKLIYKYYSKAKEKEGKKEQLLWKVLHHEYLSENQILREAAIENLSLPNKFAVLVVSLTTPGDNVLVDKVAKIFDSFSKRDRLLILKTEYQTVTIIRKDRRNESTPTEVARNLIDHIQGNLTEQEYIPLIIGVGKEYAQLINMRKSFLEALEVIETANFAGEKFNRIPFEFSKLGIYRYLASIYEKNNAEEYVNGQLLELLKKDEESQTEFLKTLELYIANNGKAKKTAEQLYIHPNTLNYRLKQIVEITNIDFEDFNMKSHLYAELLLINHIPRYYQRYKEAIDIYLKGND